MSTCGIEPPNRDCRFFINVAAFHWLFIHEDKASLVKIADQICVLLQLSYIFGENYCLGMIEGFLQVALKLKES